MNLVEERGAEGRGSRIDGSGIVLRRVIAVASSDGRPALGRGEFIDRDASAPSTQSTPLLLFSCYYFGLRSIVLDLE